MKVTACEVIAHITTGSDIVKAFRMRTTTGACSRRWSGPRDGISPACGYRRSIATKLSLRVWLYGLWLMLQLGKGISIEAAQLESSRFRSAASRVLENTSWVEFALPLFWQPR